jgi:hypothetical protein
MHKNIFMEVYHKSNLSAIESKNIESKNIESRNNVVPKKIKK